MDNLTNADLFAPFVRVQETVLAGLGTALLGVVIAIGVVILFTFIVVRVMSNRIVQPMDNLTNLTKAIIAGRFDADDANVFRSRGTSFAEVDAVIDVYKTLFTVIRLGNAGFFSAKVGQSSSAYGRFSQLISA